MIENMEWRIILVSEKQGLLDFEFDEFFNSNHVAR